MYIEEINHHVVAIKEIDEEMKDAEFPVSEQEVYWQSREKHVVRLAMVGLTEDGSVCNSKPNCTD
jgi:hypothetical protein